MKNEYERAIHTMAENFEDNEPEMYITFEGKGSKEEPEKRKLEIHLSTEVSEAQYNEIMMKLYAFVATVPLSANDRLRICGREPIDDPQFDKVFIPI